MCTKSVSPWRELSAIQKLVDQHEFKSKDELNDFLQTLTSSGELFQQQTARGLIVSKVIAPSYEGQSELLQKGHEFAYMMKLI
ncbi:MAG: hypothetical protein XD68_0447 [Synergistales bacterium 54_24]|nr:MAG: hypothetical protein XD68_0447 [Synergistales bacterium 54_24]